MLHWFLSRGERGKPYIVYRILKTRYTGPLAIPGLSLKKAVALGFDFIGFNRVVAGSSSARVAKRSCSSAGRAPKQIGFACSLPFSEPLGPDVEQPFHLSWQVALLRAVVIDHGYIVTQLDRVAAPDADVAYMINVASYQNGIGYEKKWVHIDGFSEAVVRYIIAAESERLTNRGQ